ncbi:acyl-CoA thioesterase [Terasakiella pusilla]|uniref:acyl-CoA thioesterase n=1 Tax=Terasakiella pusilla TaxID=64973 RepID=UPI003AA97171
MTNPIHQKTHLIDIVFPGDTNHHGTLFGGKALSEMDKVAFVVASRFGQRHFVTASCERLDFEGPASCGQIIDYVGRIVSAGKRSARIQVDMYAEDLLLPRRVRCTSGVFNMVATEKDRGNLPEFTPVEVTEDPLEKPAECQFVEMVFADQANHYGNLFGGHALNMMGKAAFITATRYARKVFVMASSLRNDFTAKAYVGELVELTGKVIKTGRTSLTVSVVMEAENLLTGERRLCAKSDFVMVAVDEEGRPVSID